MKIKQILPIVIVTIIICYIIRRILIPLLPPPPCMNIPGIRGNCKMVQSLPSGNYDCMCDYY